jgi:anti-anti-sigma regulatory factor
MVVSMAAANSVRLKIDGRGVVPVLHEALQKLDGDGSEVVVDFSCVRRLDPTALRALEDFVGSVNGRASQVVLRGVNIDVYKVLKLTKLAPRFSFLS